MANTGQAGNTSGKEYRINGKIFTDDTQIEFRPNPKRPGFTDYERDYERRYEKYRKANTFGEYLRLNPGKHALPDARYDLATGFLVVLPRVVPSSVVNQLAFNVENLGSVRHGSLAPKPLTLFCGPNNSGKTWVMYALYHYYRSLQRLPRSFPKGKMPGNLDKWNESMTEELPFFFNVPREQMPDAGFTLDSKHAGLWPQLASEDGFQHDAFLIPAERNGLHLFFRELSTRRTALLHHASRENIDLGELLRDVIHSRYAIPIADYINWLNSLPDCMNQSSVFCEFNHYLKKQLAGGAYKVEKSTGRITFRPYQRRHDGKAMPTLDLHVTSGNVKSLFGLWFYLQYRAGPGDILMIDEPELNIHPKNQRTIARLLARLVNAGLRVVISTHSDYIVQEVNSLIMLHQQGAEGLREKHEYEKDEIVSPDQVAAYLFDNDKIIPFEITPADGIYATTFDEVITHLNKTNNDIYYTLREQQDV